MDFDYKICVILTTFFLQTCTGQNVGFEMKISPEQPTQQFSVGNNRVLKCIASTAENNQRPTLHWEIKDVPVTATDKTSRIRVEEGADGSLMLRVDKVQDGDEGTYKCVATLGSQTDSRSVQVLVIQDLKVTSEASQYGLWGEDGIVKCEATAKPAPTITWKFFNGTKIQSGEKYIIQQDHMTIKKLTDEDTAKYWCDIVVIEVGASEEFYIDYQVVRVPKIDMIPTISPNNPKVGDPEVKITCHATGVPEPTYEYKKGDNIIAEENVDERGGILTIRDVKREDEGVYTCVARNRGGADEKSNRLDVKIAPIIHDIPDVKDAVEGGQQKVTCMAEGDPAPTVIWQKQGQPAYTNDGIRDSGPTLIDEGGKDREDAEIKTVGKTMDFTFIKPQDAGTYICTAINVVGNASKTVKFEVRYKPNFDTDYKVTTFYGWRGHTANLTCLASANDVASIRWYETRDNRTVQIENEAPYTITGPQEWPDYHLSSSSLLVYVSDETSPVFKDYTCEATNRLGSAKQTVTLKRALPPGVPNVRLPVILSTKVNAEFDLPNDNGGQPVTGYRYIYYPSTDVNNAVEKNIDSTGETTPIEMKDLKPSTDYLIKVSARNIVGLGPEQSVSFKTNTVSVPVKPDIDSPRVGSEPTSYTLRWKNIDDGGSPLTDISVRYRKVLVTGSEPAQWKVSGDVDTSFKEVRVPDVKASSYTLTNLDRDSYYDIRVIAINKQGQSQEAFYIFKTSQGGPDSNRPAVVIAVVVSLIILIIVVAIIIFLILKRKPELVDRLKKTRGGDEESAKREAEKDLNDEEQLINTENPARSENEVKAETGNCASDSRSKDNKVTANDVHQDGPRNTRLDNSTAKTKLASETTDSTSKDSPV